MKKNLYFQAQMKSFQVNGETLKLTGYASTSDEDRYDDIVLPTAFEKSINDYLNAGGTVLYGHRSDEVIGRTMSAKIDSRGLYVEIELSNDIKRADQELSLYQQIQKGMINGFSIGFIPTKVERDESNYSQRTITELDLVEISVVSIPANPKTMFTLRKSLELFMAKGVDEVEFEGFPSNEDIVNAEIVDETDEAIANGVVPSDVEVGNNDNQIVESEAEKLPENGNDSEKSIADDEAKKVSIDNEILTITKKDLNELIENETKSIRSEFELKFAEIPKFDEKELIEKQTLLFEAKMNAYNDEFNSIVEKMIGVFSEMTTKFHEIENRPANKYAGLSKSTAEAKKEGFGVKDFFNQVLASKDATL